MNLPRINLIICLGFLIFFPQCGKKAPPAAPEAIVPPVVKDLKAEIIGDRVLLTWSVLNKGNTLFDGLEHFGVYKFESHSSAEICPGCPIPFEHYLDIKLDDPRPARVEGDRIVFLETIKADQRYAYKVVVYHKSGGESKDSNIVEFAVGSDQGASAQ